LTASAESTATSGSYSIKVNNLAAAQKLTSDTNSDPLIDGGFDPDEFIGKGTIHLALGSSDAVDIAVSETSTISDVAKAINAADAGVYASVISDGNSSFLTLTGKQTGEDNVISLTVTEDGTSLGDLVNKDMTGLSRLYAGNLKETQVAANSDIAVDGVTNIIRETNTIDDVISGVTLSLKSDGSSATVSVERSDDLFTTQMNAFLDAYNGLIDSLKKLQSYDSVTKTAGTLLGDATTRQIDSKVRSLISNSVSGLSAGVNRLTDFGVSTDADGKLSLDSTVFKAKLADNFENVSTFFTKTDVGFAARMVDSMDTMLDTYDGALAVRTKGIQKSIDTIDDRITTLNDRMSSSETRLRAQFSALEVTLAKYQGLSSSLTASLAQIQNGWGTNS
jgi:flagellar hook-associated protein 2